MKRTSFITSFLAGGLLFSSPLHAHDIVINRAEPSREPAQTIIVSAPHPTPPVLFREDPARLEHIDKPQVPPLYVPPRRGYASAALRMGGGTRGGAKGPTVLAVLAPNHVGDTMQAQPILYWYAADNIKTPVEFVLIARDTVKPLLTVTLPGPIGRGIHSIRLMDYSVWLSPETIYEWSVVVVTDSRHRAKDIVATGEIERVPFDTPLNLEGQDKYLLYASHGLWYDAVMEVTDQLEKAHAPAAFRFYRAALAETVGLHDVAVYDRSVPVHK